MITRWKIDCKVWIRRTSSDSVSVFYTSDWGQTQLVLRWRQRSRFMPTYGCNPRTVADSWPLTIFYEHDGCQLLRRTDAEIEAYSWAIIVRMESGLADSSLSRTFNKIIAVSMCIIMWLPSDAKRTTLTMRGIRHQQPIWRRIGDVSRRIWGSGPHYEGTCDFQPGNQRIKTGSTTV